MTDYGEVEWRRPRYARSTGCLTNPSYGGAYAYGKTSVTMHYDGVMARGGSRRKPPGTHEGYVDWERSEAIRRMVSDNIPNSRHHGTAKHGDALLAGLIRCHRCGRKLTIRYTGAKHNIPRYSYSPGSLDNGEPRCIAFGGLRVDDAIEAAILKLSNQVPSPQRSRLMRSKRRAVTSSATPWSGTWKRCPTPLAPSDNTTRPIPSIVWWRRSWSYAGPGNE